MGSEEVKKSHGVTHAERYLGKLCEQTFLSLWSYPSVTRDVFIPGTKTGKEICDLLVVFENRLIIFSDKDCKVPRTGNLELDWSRWFRKAVVESAIQAYGAERWIRKFPTRVFLDKECTRPLPVAPVVTPGTRFHLVVVSHNIAERCHEELGGSGSLMIDSTLEGVAAHTVPFKIGDLDKAESFVHVLDDTSLHVLMTELDTISDFVLYLDKKEEFVRTRVPFFAAGEEELLAWYVRHVNNNKNEHYFHVPPGSDTLVFEEGLYAGYLDNPQRIAKVQANRISYSWDMLIEKFSHHALHGTQYFATPGGVSETERILRFMARESRTRRRMLAEKLVGIVVNTPPDYQRTAILLPSAPGDPYYLFLLVPKKYARSNAEYREVRLNFLKRASEVLRLTYPDALDVIGIATEPGDVEKNRSEDAVYVDFRYWTPELEQQAREFQKQTGLLTRTRMTEGTTKEYPDPPQPFKVSGENRNKPCPCGSGKKFKNCHGKNE